MLFSEDDYLFYLQRLSDACEQHEVFVHAYVLMKNHVHLLLTPNTTDGISRVLQSLGRRYVQYINKIYRRTGTLWEKRYKACLVNAEKYLLACYRYIERNPVRANKVEHPADYRWSSYSVNAGIRPRRQLTPHDIYLRLGLDETSRCQVYRELFAVDLNRAIVHDIEKAATFSAPLGDSHFQTQIGHASGRSVGHAGRGRPGAGK